MPGITELSAVTFAERGLGVQIPAGVAGLQARAFTFGTLQLRVTFL